MIARLRELRCGRTRPSLRRICRRIVHARTTRSPPTTLLTRATEHRRQEHARARRGTDSRALERRARTRLSYHFSLKALTNALRS